MRPTNFNVDADKLKDYFLDVVVDSNGKRVSYRKIWYSEEFLAFAKYKRRSNGDDLSPGNIWYWVNKKWKLTLDYIFDYHKNVTKRIKPDTKFEEWASCSGQSANVRETEIKFNEVIPHIARATINKLIEVSGDGGLYYCGEYGDVEVYFDLLKTTRRYRKNTNRLLREFRETYAELRKKG